jgi:hypothetical protein
MVTNRVNILWGILGLVGGMALGAWYMGSRIQSPAEWRRAPQRLTHPRSLFPWSRGY